MSFKSPEEGAITKQASRDKSVVFSVFQYTNYCCRYDIDKDSPKLSDHVSEF